MVEADPSGQAKKHPLETAGNRLTRVTTGARLARSPSATLEGRGFEPRRPITEKGRARGPLCFAGSVLRSLAGYIPCLEGRNAASRTSDQAKGRDPHE